MTNTGEEATSVGSTSALKFEDWIFPQYREAGALMRRGFTIQEMANQLSGNHLDQGKAKQMPVHYGKKGINFVTVSSTLCTQVPQASGAGYQFRISGKDQIAITYFGEGAASEGDFHSALNFAATLRAQTLFFCRNNMYAISTPIDDQYAGDGIAVRGVSYGMPSVRVDGNDLLAVYAATKKAREIIIKEKRPALIECMTYRVGDHSTSDFSEMYRHPKEMEKWKELLEKFSDPINRLEKYLRAKGWVGETTQKEIRDQTKKEVREALKKANQELRPSIDHLFNDVYDVLPKNLEEQKSQLREHLRKHGKEYPLDRYKDGENFP